MKQINELTDAIIGSACRIHTALGPGLLESVYEAVLAYELAGLGLTVNRQVSIPIRYNGLLFEQGFRADLIVENRVIVELKSVDQLAAVHAKQVLTQLRLSGLRVGLLINFGESHLKNGIKRFVNGFSESSASSVDSARGT